jgi:hypothetical protein
LFGKYLTPKLGKVAIGDIDPARVRAWRAGLIEQGVSVTMVAKAYRLLRAILMTAADDGIIARNPCRIRGAGSEQTQERPVLMVDRCSSSRQPCRRGMRRWSWWRPSAVCVGAR